MTYLVQQNPNRTRAGLVKRRRRGKPPALSGIVDVITNPFGTIGGLLGISSPSDAVSNAIKKQGLDQASACVVQANQYTGQLDDKWMALAQNWKPTGVYNPADVSTIVGIVSNSLIQAKMKVMLAPWTTSDATDQIAQAIDDIDKKINDGARFSNAAATAAASNSVINAPDLKDWVTSSLMAASNALATAFVLSCDVTWLESMLSTIQTVIDTVVQIAGVVLSVAVDAGKAVVNVAKGAFDAGAFITQYSMPIILGVAGYFAYKWFVKDYKKFKGQ